MGNSVSYQEAPVEVALGHKGRLRGTCFGNKACRYAGVPYALPPVGEHRWRRPRPLPASHVYTDGCGGPYGTEHFRAVCPQKPFHVAEADEGNAGYSEDCLFLNIWTPVGSKQESSNGWPVMLWLHGGWFQMGDPSQTPDMDPTELISTGGLNAIVVAIGYRLNIFGFLAGEDLLRESDGVSGGNYGLLDQYMAFEWVHDNIRFFGGNPDNITLCGRSAGAYAVEAHMLYELRRKTARAPLFHRVFLDSNAIPAQPKSLSTGQEQLEELCQHFELSSDLSANARLVELRKRSWQDLLSTIAQMRNHTFRPVTDDILIHDGMMEYIDSTLFAADFKHAGFRMLSCEVLNEETLYSIYNAPTQSGLDPLRLQVSNYYAPDVTDRVLQSYDMPATQDLKDWQRLFGAIVADGQVRAPARLMAKSLKVNGVSIRDLWRCQVAYRLSFITEEIAPLSLGVAHAMDKPFWNFSISQGPTSQEHALMKSWIEILVAFVQNDHTYDFGTTNIEDLKTATPEGTIEIHSDLRWAELIAIGKIFAGNAA